MTENHLLAGDAELSRHIAYQADWQTLTCGCRHEKSAADERPGLHRSPFIDRCQQLLAAQNISTGVLQRFPRIREITRSKPRPLLCWAHDGVVAMGGGSGLDARPLASLP